MTLVWSSEGDVFCEPPKAPKGFLSNAKAWKVFHTLEDGPLAVLQKDKVYQTVVRTFHVHHLHVYPCQLMLPEGSDEVLGATEHLEGGKELQKGHDIFPDFFKHGDWHDTLQMGTYVRLRFRTTNFVGPVILHCHMLEHEDAGMMNYLMVK